MAHGVAFGHGPRRERLRMVAAHGAFCFWLSSTPLRCGWYGLEVVLPERVLERRGVHQVVVGFVSLVAENMDERPLMWVHRYFRE